MSYLTKILKLEKEKGRDTKHEVPCKPTGYSNSSSISSIEIQLRSEPISLRPIPNKWKIHDIMILECPKQSPSVRFRSYKTPFALKPFGTR